jgi:hypothetical protein
VCSIARRVFTSPSTHQRPLSAGLRQKAFLTAGVETSTASVGLSSAALLCAARPLPPPPRAAGPQSIGPHTQQSPPNAANCVDSRDFWRQSMTTDSAFHHRSIRVALSFRHAFSSTSVSHSADRGKVGPWRTDWPRTSAHRLQHAAGQRGVENPRVNG